jgi:hypothetical protein
MGIDGAMCDLCVEALAPWMNEPVDPYLLALWSLYGNMGVICFHNEFI